VSDLRMLFDQLRFNRRGYRQGIAIPATADVATGEGQRTPMRDGLLGQGIFTRRKPT